MLRPAMPSQREKRAIQKVLKPKGFRKKSIAEMDTTEYLLSNPANRAHLLKAIEDVKNGNIIYRDLIEV